MACIYSADAVPHFQFHRAFADVSFTKMPDVLPFIQTLHDIVSDTKCDELISWNKVEICVVFYSMFSKLSLWGSGISLQLANRWLIQAEHPAAAMFVFLSLVLKSSSVGSLQKFAWY